MTNTSPSYPAVLSAAFNNTPPIQVTYPALCLQVNTTAVGYIPHNNVEYEVGITSSCNSGNRLLAAWWNIAAGAIFYKLTPNIQYQFRPAGINTEENKVVGFTIYPNPAKNSIWLKCKDFDIETIQILNAFGKVEMKVLDSQSPINISSLPSGNYFISIQMKDGSRVTQPFIKD